MNNQKIFDRVATHLMTQKVRAMAAGSGACAYRGTNGLSCAMGCLMGRHYRKGMEGSPIGIVLSGYQEFAKHIGYEQGDEQGMLLLSKLTELHDSDPPETWPNGLRKMAKDHNLTMP